MSASFIAKKSILPAAQLKLWPQLGELKNLGFVLYGGTAVALRLGHRQSIDFDFFSSSPLDRRTLLNSTALLAKGLTLQDQGNTWVLQLRPDDKSLDEVKVSFFGSLDFGRVATPFLTDDGVLKVAALEDLMATKLKVILQRAEAKDYKDIAAMLKADVSLAHGLASARVLFGKNFQPSESLKALSYFEDGDLSSLSLKEKQMLVKASCAVGDLPEMHRVSDYLA